MSDTTQQVKDLIDKATKVDATDALKFTQAALNAAHAMQVLELIKKI